MEYYPLTIAGSVLFVYFVSYIYTRKNILTRKINYPFTVHRKIWNLILLILFLVFAPLGFVLSLNETFPMDLEESIIQGLHVNFGVAFLAVGIFHALWHLNYFKKAVQKLFTRDLRRGKK